MKFVIDASVLAKVVVKERDSDKALKLIEAHTDGKIELIAPSIIIYEVGNVLWRHKMDAKSMHMYIVNILSLGIKLVDPHSEKELLEETCEISKIKGLTFYDASYVSTAKSLKIKLVTVDKEMMRKAGEYVISMDEIEIR
ncbi:MAG: type II toxin-antitoxin system VapC family toxin [Halobacteriota archaeon]|nr:type II toxin-antitoxin system VapC family toxin [Halobacteriota archaeon]